MTDAPPSTEFWAAMFDGAAETYDRSGVPFFGPIAAGLVDLLTPTNGERALDLGSGRGAATLPLAAAVAPDGGVTAVDASGRMVELLTSDIASRGLTNVTVVQGDAAAPPGGPYDVVCGSLVLFFLPDPVAALSAWRAAAARGGRVGISSFAPWPDTMRSAMKILEAYRPDVAQDTVGMPEAFRTDEGVEALFADAGYTEVATTRATYEIPYRDVEQFRRWSLGTALRGLWQHVPEARAGEAMERLAEVLAAHDHRLHVDIRYTLAGV
jgi:trans-aconitate methyltransferase